MRHDNRSVGVKVPFWEAEIGNKELASASSSDPTLEMLFFSCTYVSCWPMNSSASTGDQNWWCWINWRESSDMQKCVFLAGACSSRLALDHIVSNWCMWWSRCVHQCVGHILVTHCLHWHDWIWSNGCAAVADATVSAAAIKSAIFVRRLDRLMQLHQRHNQPVRPPTRHMEVVTGTIVGECKCYDDHWFIHHHTRMRNRYTPADLRQNLTLGDEKLEIRPFCLICDRMDQNHHLSQ